MLFLLILQHLLSLLSNITHGVLYFMQQRIMQVDFVIFLRNGEIAIQT